MIRMMCGVRLVDRVSTDGLLDRVSVVVKFEDMTIQSRLPWYGHVIRRDINSQIHEIMELKITGKRKKGQPRKLRGECTKKDLGRYGLRREDPYDPEKWRERIKAKMLTPASPPPAGLIALKRTLLLLLSPSSRSILKGRKCLHRHKLVQHARNMLKSLYQFERKTCRYVYGYEHY